MNTEIDKGWDKEEKWIFEKKDAEKHTDSSIKYIQYFTLFFILFFSTLCFIAFIFI
jgi:hypothetical protein